MPNKVNYIPEGYNKLTPYLLLKNGGELIEFYKKVFGAKELMRMPAPGGKIGHAELQIGDCRFMMADECPDGKSPLAYGGSPVILALYVENVDEVFQRAIDAGANSVKPIANQFYGDRTGMISDPSGHLWSLATHIEDVSPEEMARRAAALHKPK